MDYQYLIVDKGPIYTVTYNRPERMNALAPRTFQEITEVCEEFNTDPAARVMIVTGAGEKAFSAGLDLKELDAVIDRGSTQAEYVSFRDCTRYGFLQAEKPVIAAVNGYCLAGGMEMALSCDIRVAAEHATFGMPEPRRGILPGQAMVYLARYIPHGEAMYIMLTGGHFSAQEAHRIGLVHQVVPLANLMSTATAIAQEILECAPLAVRAIKEAVRHITYVPPELASRLLSATIAQNRTTEDSKEGPRAFAEKRDPVWKGR